MKQIAAAIRGRRDGHIIQNVEIRGNTTNALTSVGKDNMILEIYERTDAT